MEEQDNFYPNKITALGGLDEMDKNCYHIHPTWSGCWFKYPRRYTLGIHDVRPDFSDLESIKDRIKTIIIAHRHDDQFVALPYLTIFCKVSIYITKTTRSIIKAALMKKFPDVNNYNIKIVGSNWYSFCWYYFIWVIPNNTFSKWIFCFALKTIDWDYYLYWWFYEWLCTTGWL